MRRARARSLHKKYNHCVRTFMEHLHLLEQSKEDTQQVMNQQDNFRPEETPMEPHNGDRIQTQGETLPNLLALIGHPKPV